MPKVAVILINYKDYAKKYLPECLASLRNQSYPKDSFKVFIVDNATTPETAAYLRATAPEAEIILEEKNSGFAEGSNLAMRRALDANYDYIVLFNMDTIADPEWLRELVAAAEADRSVGAIQSLIRLHPETEKINSLGNQMHFLGFGFCEGYGEKISNLKPPISRQFFYASGASALYPVKVLREIGLFDSEFFMYHEDTDLSWRVRQAGYKIVLAEKSVMYHKYQFSRSILQFYYMERNRMIMMFENYRLGTLILIFLPFLFMELGMLAYAALRGMFWTKIKAYGYFFHFKNWRRMIKNKKAKAKLRKIKDRELARLIVGKLEFQEIANPILKYIVNPVFNLYWRVVRNLIFW
ncbi:glycosyltransferase family 2 protein [Candidatus Falkowbacteria bacterium]|nr:glycosyltransferase family 2 protein [Candidatus Falkowbacteria bacterium]